MNDTFRPVAPARTAAPYIGGKRRLAAALVERIQTVPHQLYAEPFVGMGGVFFHRLSAPPTEVINDVSKDVGTFFRILQRHYPQFMETLKFQITSRREFERLSACDPSTLTDLERAARFLYLQRLAFGGRVTGRNFGMVRDGGSRFDVTKLGPLLEEIHERLAGVVIECLPWSTFIANYDHAQALFYLDPPYFGSETDYGPVFGPEDFGQLADVLGKLKGRFILSINDAPQIRSIFAGFHIEAVRTRYTVAGSGWQAAEELIISDRHTGPLGLF